jgi:hypothetical protein
MLLPVHNVQANFTIKNAPYKNKPRHPCQMTGLVSIGDTEQRLKPDFAG